MYVSRAVISNEPFDAISASSDFSRSSRFSPRELIVDLKTLISALAAAADANLPGEARLIETHSLPSSLAASRRGFALITPTSLVLAPATLAALPSTRAISQSCVFCLANPIGSAAGRLFTEVISRMDEQRKATPRGIAEPTPN
jgi:hypothetical protein